MFKLILIDDEIFTLNTLSNLINWQEFKFELCKTFTNPNLALDYLKCNHVDVVITDINMPKMSGIELTKEIRKFNKNVKIVFLTAYSEFTYAQKAIEYDVCSYILKPINIAVLKETLIKLKNNLQSNLFFKKTADYDEVAARSVICEYLSENNSSYPSKVYEELINCHLEINETSPCSLIEMQIDNLNEYLKTMWKYGILRLYSSFDNFFIQNGLYIIPISYTFDTIELFAICNRNTTKSFAELILEFENSLVANCADALQLNVQLKIKNTFSDISKINVSVGNTIFEKATKLFNLLKQSEPHCLPKENILSYFSSHSNEEKRLITEMLIIIFAEYCDENDLQEVSMLFTEFLRIKNTDNMTESFSNIIHTIHNYFSGEQNTDEKIINLSKKYIQSNYANNISLQDVADYVHVSAAHLSRLFKSVNKKNYIDYLNEIRIENAKTLLAFSETKATNIAYEVGYGSYPYFLKVFKMHTGMTPVEYKNKYYKKSE